MLRIENEYFRIELNEIGGCFKAIYDKKNNEELLYQPNGSSWSGQDVVIFPVIGALKNHKYLVDGQEYYLKNHGIIRYDKVKYNKISDTVIELYYEYNENSLKIYPFKFKFVIKYILEANKINVLYNVVNQDNRKMYFYLGGHPALKASGQYINNHFEFENTYCIFDGTISKRYILNSTGDQITGSEIVSITDKFIIEKKEIENYKTLIFSAEDLKKVVLYTNNYEYNFDISNAPVLAIWSMKDTGNFICIEPWWGLPDEENSKLELKDKDKILKLDANEEYETGYSICISKV